MTSFPTLHAESRPGVIVIARDVPAIQVPGGFSDGLVAGTEVELVHELGGDFTVRTRLGALYRIAGQDADAVGRARPAPLAAADAGPVDEPRVRELLRSVYDPEIPVNVVDLGLIYEILFEPGLTGGRRVMVKMALTAPGCGMGQVLCDDIKRRVVGLPGVEDCVVEVVLDPPWNPAMMTEEARFQVGLF